MSTLKEAIQYAQENPNSSFATDLRGRITTGSFDSKAQDEGIDLSGISPTFHLNVGDKNIFQRVGNDFAQRGEDLLNKVHGTQEAIKGTGLLGNIAGIGETAGNIVGSAAGGLINAGVEAGKSVINTLNGDQGQKLAQGIEDFKNSTNILGQKNGDTLKSIGDFMKQGTDNLPPNVVDSFHNFLNTIGLMGGGKLADMPIGKVVDVVKSLPETIKGGVDAVKNTIGKVKEGIIPSVTLDEAVGHIIQGETGDIASAKRALSSLDTTGLKTYKDIQAKIKLEIPKLAKKVDNEFAKDTIGKSIKDFEQTVGEGKSAVKVNYVKQALSDLIDYYKKTGNASGLSKIKLIENNAKIKGMTYGDVNELARLHGKDINAFNANGEAASGLTKQAAENTRKGLKTTARQGLGGTEAQALDAKLSDLYDTQSLIDKMVEKVNTASQKIPKQGVIPKTVGKVVKTVDTLTGSPLKAIGKQIGNVGATGAMSAVEIEQNLEKYLKTLKSF